MAFRTYPNNIKGLIIIIMMSMEHSSFLSTYFAFTRFFDLSRLVSIPQYGSRFYLFGIDGMVTFNNFIMIITVPILMYGFILFRVGISPLFLIFPVVLAIFRSTICFLIKLFSAQFTYFSFPIFATSFVVKSVKRFLDIAFRTYFGYHNIKYNIKYVHCQGACTGY